MDNCMEESMWLWEWWFSIDGWGNQRIWVYMAFLVGEDHPLQMALSVHLCLKPTAWTTLTALMLSCPWMMGSG